MGRNEETIANLELDCNTEVTAKLITHGAPNPVVAITVRNPHHTGDVSAQIEGEDYHREATEVRVAAYNEQLRRVRDWLTWVIDVAEAEASGG